MRGLVGTTYAGVGRPSIDPVVFVKLQLVMLFEGLRSERQLLRAVADRLSLRWCIEYDLTAPLPDQSRLTRCRSRSAQRSDDRLRPSLCVGRRREQAI